MLTYIFIALANSVVDFGSASFIHPCDISYGQCLKAAQAAIPLMAPGIPALGMEPLDPLVLPVIIRSHIGSLDLEFVYTKFEGLKNCILLGIKVNSKKTKHTISAKCHVVVTGFSSFHGILAYRTVIGDGSFEIVLYEIIIRSVAYLTTVEGKDRKRHYKIINWRYSFQVPKEPDFRFQNIALDSHYTNKTTLAEFIHHHWMDVVQEFVPPLVRPAIAKVYSIIAKFFEARSIDEISFY